MRKSKTIHDLKDWQPDDFVDIIIGEHTLTKEQTAFSRHKSGIDYLIRDIYWKYCGMRENVDYNTSTGLIIKSYTPI